MSGGHFNYDQYRITYISDQISEVIRSNDNEELNKWGDRVGRRYSAETIKEFENALEALNRAFVYAHRIDWLLSCDDGEDTFHKRLKEDLK